MNLNDFLMGELEMLGEFEHVEKDVLEGFEKRLDGGKLTRDENEKDHVCEFFVPVDTASGSVFLGHHKKANMWIPPGGHIEKGELPKQTVKREFEEELGSTLSEESIILHTLTVVDIENKTDERSCRRHWDLWYGVKMAEMQNFTLDSKEFYSGRWLRLVDAPEIMDPVRKNYIEALQTFGELV